MRQETSVLFPELACNLKCLPMFFVVVSGKQRFKFELCLEDVGKAARSFMASVVEKITRLSSAMCKPMFRQAGERRLDTSMRCACGMAANTTSSAYHMWVKRVIS